MEPSDPTQNNGFTEQVDHNDGVNLQVNSGAQEATAPYTTGIANEDLETPIGAEEPPNHSQENQEYTRKRYSVEDLESTVENGVRVLGMLEKIFEKYDGCDQPWESEIAKVMKTTDKTKFVIGIIGTTGAGKSSLINALVDEERLVPTNCLRACTSVATEISYNDGPLKYKARIEFIQRDAWEKELRILFQDVKDSSGDPIHDILPRDSEAATALDKIKAVYPSLSKEDILGSSVEKLLENPKLLDIFGTTLVFEENDPKVFYKRLKDYVDSKDKRRGKKKDAHKNDFEWWPLIRVVKLYVKADALSTGAIIVDLPGVQDTNTARVAVAQEYMKKCSAHWIVAPITRAVDDAIARKLLGDNLKRQLAMDCAFETITFVCTKTDDISTIEAQEALNLEFSTLLDESEARTQERILLQNEIDELHTMAETVQAELNDIVEKIITWHELLDSQRDGQDVYTPLEFSSPLKRKRPSSDTRPDRKRQEVIDSDDELALSENSEDTSEETELHNVDAAPERIRPLTESDVNEKLDNLRNRRGELVSKRSDLANQIEEKERTIRDISSAEEDMQALINIKCIRARNIYSKDAIRRDFASGLKELDDEHLEELDPENFDPTIQLRDYEKLGKNLPVFCVSSRGYQKLSGRLRRDSLIPGFMDPADTAIPQLQKHCRLLADAARESACLNSIRELSQLFQSLNLWSIRRESNDVSEKKRIELESELIRQFSTLKTDMGTLIGRLFAQQCDTFEKLVFERLTHAANRARAKAMKVVYRWNTPQEDIPSGYRWNTYQAICRRAGVHQNNSGNHDWNQDLCEPMLKDILPWWQQAFNIRLPEQLRQATTESAALVQAFHDSLATEKEIVQGHSRIILASQKNNFCRSLDSLFASAEKSLKESQRTISRELTPVIAEAIESAYNECSVQSGTGVLRRMRGIMEAKIETARNAMYKECVKRAVKSFQEHLKNVGDDITNGISVLLDNIWRDYYAAIVAPQLASFNERQLAMKDEIANIIKEAQRELDLERKLLQERISTQLGDSGDDDTAGETDVPTPSAMDVLSDHISVKMEYLTDN